MAFQPSKYQQAIFDWVSNETGHAVVKARAGSGKTSTIVEALNLMKGRVLFCAFNKHIAEELARQLAVRGITNVDVRTVHSLGNGALRRSIGNFRLDDNKYKDLLFRKLDDQRAEMDKTVREAILRLVDLSRMTLTDARDPKAMELLVDRYNVDTNGSLPVILQIVPELIDAGQKLTTIIDFADMIWLPNVLKIAMPRYDWVCVDEAQDLNRAQRELVLSAGRSGRVLAVGDDFQSIYGFSGADTESIPRFIEILKAKTLPLSICYRCPKTHIEMAKKLVPDIEARPDAPDGEIVNAPYDTAVAEMNEKDMVLCRINAPLAKIALGLIRNGKKASIRGRDIGKGLINLIAKRMDKSLPFDDSLVELTVYGLNECMRLERLDKTSKAESLRDRIDTIIALADGVKSIAELYTRIENIFTDEKHGIVCSSVHRAKGLQSERIFIYRPELFETFKGKARNADTKQQECNVEYVSYTRATRSLWLVKRAPSDE